MLLRVQLDGQERRLSYEELEEAVRLGKIGPETPLDSGEGWRPARDWVDWETVAMGPASRVRARWDDPPVPWATALIVGTCARIFVWTLPSDLVQQGYARLDRSSVEILESHEVWRLWTYAFFHANVGHIVMNMLLIVYVGLGLERLLRGRDVLILFFATIMGGALLSTFWAPQTQSIGASAGDFGFMGAAGVLGLRWAEVMPRRAQGRFGFVMVGYAAYALLSAIDAEKVDNMAHFGGLLTGALLGALFDPTRPERNDRVGRATIGVMLAVAGGIAALGWRLEPTVPLAVDGAETVRPAWWEVGWLPTGEQGWISPTKDAYLTLISEERPTLTDAPTVLADWSEDLKRLDAAAVVTPEGDRTSARYTADRGPREAYARAIVHGRHASTVIVDLPAGDGRAVWLERALTALTVAPPEEVQSALEGADSPAWRLRMQAAEAAGNWGDEARARAIAESVLTLAPEDPAAALAVVRLARRDRWADALTRAEAASLRFPLDRSLVAERATALVDAGRATDAAALLDAALLAAPGDLVLRQARDALSE